MSKYSAIYDLFLPEAMKVSARLKWRTDKPTQERIRKLLDIVLSESLLSRRCPSCHGTKNSIINPAKHCEACKGTGLFNNFDYLKANYLEIIAINGDSSNVQKLAQELKTKKGITQLKLAIVTP